MPPRPTARFTPIDPSKCLLFVGQDVSSILEYADSVRGGRNVFGITSYTALSDTPGFSLRGLRPDLGECPVDYGAGPVDSSAVLHELPFAALSLGLDLTGARLAGIAAGMHDTSLADLGRYFRDLAPRPVFLRIGYEFDGPWNGYSPPEDYIAAYQHIVRTLRVKEQVRNVAFVWQSATSRHCGQVDMLQWWPGPEYVDWVGASWFEFHPSSWDAMASIARRWKKPVFICEAAPQGYVLPGGTRASCTGNGSDAQKVSDHAVWTQWFDPLFQFVSANRDLVGAVAYINCHWDNQGMWGPPFNSGYWGDTRVSTKSTPELTRRFEEQVNSDSWLRASPTSWAQLETGK